MMHRRFGFVALVFVLRCSHPNDTPAMHPDASVTAATTHAAELTTTPPENLLLSIRGASLRRAVPLLFPQAGAAEVLEQVSRQVTPGIGQHGDEIDVDSPVAVAGTITGQDESTLTFFVAWPLRPGMQIAQDARAQRGYRRVDDGVYAPSSPDAGSTADNQCWVAQRHPVGWMLVCGPREGIEQVAGLLHQQADTPPDNAAVIDVDVRTAVLRRLLTRQLAELDRQAPPHADSGEGAFRRAIFDQARRSAALMTAIANDLDALHGTITQDENAMHLSAELTVARASSDPTRALLAACAGRSSSAGPRPIAPGDGDLVGDRWFRPHAHARCRRPGSDRSANRRAGRTRARARTHDGGRTEEPDTLGRTHRRVLHRGRVHDVSRGAASRRAAIRERPACRNQLRAESRPLPEGGTLRDIATSLPTPGLTGTNVLRHRAKTCTFPPGAQSAA